MTLNVTVTLLLTVAFIQCHGQTNTTVMKKDTTTSNPLLCDPVTGVCEIPASGNSSNLEGITSKQKPVKVIYFTDPICSTCWGIEPQLRKLKLEYGKDVEISYHMGGLLPDWSYNSGGISKPSDVAHHWDEVSQHYKMPIDGDVWLTDPLPSSYPPSIAFKAAQLQDEQKAISFLRTLREMVFLQKKNITKWEHIEQAGQLAGLDTRQLKTDYEGKAKELFDQDLQLARKMGVRGFPTLFISNTGGDTELIYGFKPYMNLENGIRKVYAGAAKNDYPKDGKSLFNIYPSLTLREFAELGEISFEAADAALDALVKEGHISVSNTKNGAIWYKK